MGNALLNIKPHQVSRDLRGYSVMLYGTPKSGKTYNATRFPKHLLLAFEKGYNAIPGAMVQPINSWRDFRNVLIDLRDEEVKKTYETIIIDTADIAYDYCVDYICNQNDVDTIGDLAYGKGYALVAKEFDSCIRKILNMDYGLVLISHSTDRTEKDEHGEEYTRMEPTLDKRGRLICERTCDIVGLSRPTKNEDGTVTTKLFMRETPRFMAGSRFKYIDPVIEFTYDNLVDAIKRAIDKEEEISGQEYITSARMNAYEDNQDSEPLDFDALKSDFTKLAGELMAKSESNRAKITKIVTEYLGNGNKIGDATPNQAPQIELINNELRALLK